MDRKNDTENARGRRISFIHLGMDPWEPVVDRTFVQLQPAASEGHWLSQLHLTYTNSRSEGHWLSQLHLTYTNSRLAWQPLTRLLQKDVLDVLARVVRKPREKK